MTRMHQVSHSGMWRMLVVLLSTSATWLRRISHFPPFLSDGFIFKSANSDTTIKRNSNRKNNNQMKTKKSPASSSVSRLSRMCRRSPVRMQPGSSAGMTGCSSNSGTSGSQDWVSFPARQMSDYPSDFGSFVGESFLVVDGIEGSRHLQQYHHHHHAGQGSLLLQPHLRSESVSPEPASLRLVEPSSSGLAYLERGIS